MALTTKFYKANTLATTTTNIGYSVATSGAGGTPSLGGPLGYSVYSSGLTTNQNNAVSVYLSSVGSVTGSSALSSVIYTVPAGRTAKVIFNPGLISDFLSRLYSYSVAATGSLYYSYGFYSGSVSVLNTASTTVSVLETVTNSISCIISINNIIAVNYSAVYLASFLASSGVAYQQVFTSNLTFGVFNTSSSALAWTAAPVATTSTVSAATASTISSFFLGPNDTVVLSAIVNNSIVVNLLGTQSLSWAVTTSATGICSLIFTLSGSTFGSLLATVSGSQLSTPYINFITIEESAS